MSRKDAREFAYKLIFESLFDNNDSETKDIMYSVTESLNSNDKDYIDDVVSKVKDNYDELRDIIAKHVDNFAVDRVFKPDFAVLLLALAEIKYRDDIPMKVSIDEAVELSKRYSVENGYKFVNGVLGAISRDMKENN